VLLVSLVCLSHAAGSRGIFISPDRRIDAGKWGLIREALENR